MVANISKSLLTFFALSLVFVTISCNKIERRESINAEIAGVSENELISIFSQSDIGKSLRVTDRMEGVDGAPVLLLSDSRAVVILDAERDKENSYERKKDNQFLWEVSIISKDNKFSDKNRINYINLLGSVDANFIEPEQPMAK